jgi:RNA polymerase sigma-B factor
VEGRAPRASCPPAPCCTPITGEGDVGAREQLIEDYLPLVRRIARQHAGRGEQLEDLVQVGSIG